MASSKEAQMWSLMECPVCYSLPDKGLYNCSKGHSICSECSKKLHVCCYCSSPLTQSRNFMMESLIEFFRNSSIKFEDTSLPTTSKKLLANNLVPCPNQRYGCEGRGYIGHSEDCKLGPIKCIIDGENCKTEAILLSEYDQHLQKVHNINIIYQRACHDGVSLYFRWDYAFSGLTKDLGLSVNLLVFRSSKFLCHACIRNGKVYYWIQLVGADKFAAKYKATIRIGGPNQEMIAEWTVPVYSLRSGREEIIMENDGNNFFLTTAKLEKMCFKDTKTVEGKQTTHSWVCNIELKKLKNKELNLFNL